MTEPRPSTLSLTPFRDPADFARVVEASMMKSEAAHCLQLGLLADMRAGHHQKPYLATVDDQSAARGAPPLLTVMRTPPHRLILGEPQRGAAAHELLPPLLAALPGDLPGLVGPVELGQAFAEAYAERHGVDARLSMAERIYQCEEVSMPAGVPGLMRRAVEMDTDLLVNWWRAFREEAAPSEPDRAEQSVARDLHADPGGLWLWEVAGEPVAFAGARGPTPHGMRIGPVYTPPERRNNGFAAALVGGLTQMLLGEGRRFVFLFTDLANPTANALYQRLGYRGVADRSMYDFVPPAAGAARQGA